jgi:hypothetical protein
VSFGGTVYIIADKEHSNDGQCIEEDDLFELPGTLPVTPKTFRGQGQLIYIHQS